MKNLVIVLLTLLITAAGCVGGPTSKGIKLYNQALYGSAIAEFTKVIEKNPESEEAYTYRALSFYNKGENRLAALDLGIAVNLNPGYAPAFRALGLVYSRTGPLKFADKYFKKAIELDPGYLEGYRAYADYAVKHGRKADAVKLYQTALPNCSGPQDPLYNTLLSEMEKLKKSGK